MPLKKCARCQLTPRRKSLPLERGRATAKIGSGGTVYPLDVRSMFGPIPLPRYAPGPFFTSLPYCFYPFPMRDESRMFSTVEEAVEEIRQGRMGALVDDEDPRTEGALAMAAEKITPAANNFMAKH